MVKRSSLTDPEIRQALHSMLVNHEGKADAVLIDELGICQGRGRIDVAVVHDALHGYEIKSDRDSLRRLPYQVEMYGKVVDKATLVVGPRHLSESLTLVPNWWGVIQADWGVEGVCFKIIRQGRSNPNVEARSLVELLWRDDAIGLLNKRGGAYGVRTKPRRMVWDRVCDRFELEEIAAEVRQRLIARVMPRGLPEPS